MIDGEYFVTPHAVHQFIERIPGYRRFSFEGARAVIIASMRDHVHSVRPTQNGVATCIRVRSPHVNFRALVAAPSDNESCPSVVTILRSGR